MKEHIAAELSVFGGAGLHAHAAGAYRRRSPVHRPPLPGEDGISPLSTGAVFLRASPTLTTLPGLLSRLGAAAGAGSRFGSAMEGESAVIARLEDRGALVVVDEAHLRQGDCAVIARRCLMNCGASAISPAAAWC